MAQELFPFFSFFIYIFFLKNERRNDDNQERGLNGIHAKNLLCLRFVEMANNNKKKTK